VLARQAGPDGGFYKPDGNIADASDNYSGSSDQGERTDILNDRLVKTTAAGQSGLWSHPGLGQYLYQRISKRVK